MLRNLKTYSWFPISLWFYTYSTKKNCIHIVALFDTYNIKLYPKTCYGYWWIFYELIQLGFISMYKMRLATLPGIKTRSVASSYKIIYKHRN